jgi:hypothetical protein
VSSIWQQARIIELDQLPGWLAKQQPAELARRPNWWLGIIQSLGTDMPDRLVAVIEQAVAESALSRQEAAIRLGHLANLTAPENRPPALNPDTAVRRCLSLIDLDPARASELSERWRQEPIETIRELRRIKNLLSPVRELTKQLSDPELATKAQHWLAVLPRLP